MAVKHLEQLHQRQGRFGFAVLVAREGIDPATENLGGFPLIKRILPAEARVGTVDKFQGQEGLVNTLCGAMEYSASMQ